MFLKKTKLKDVFLINQKTFKDSRGLFFENYNKKKYENFLKDFSFVQDNISISKKNVLRGLHFQKKNSQGKLVSVLKGSIIDVIVDLRKQSSTFSKWQKFFLSEANQNQLWIPPGFAHGFETLEKNTIVLYKCTKFYDPENEITLLWNDPDLKIKWSKKKYLISKKDLNGLSFKELPI